MFIPLSFRGAVSLKLRPSCLHPMFHDFRGPRQVESSAILSQSSPSFDGSQNILSPLLVMPDVGFGELHAGLTSAELVHLAVQRIEALLRVLTWVRIARLPFALLNFRDVHIMRRPEMLRLLAGLGF